MNILMFPIDNTGNFDLDRRDVKPQLDLTSRVLCRAAQTLKQFSQK